MNKYIVIIPLSIIIILFAVHAYKYLQPIERSDIVGRYCANMTYARSLNDDAFILVDHDGSFIHHYVDNDGREVNEKGTWEFEKINSRYILTLYDYHSLKKSDKVVYKAIWPAKVVRFLTDNRLRLVVSEDMYYFYETCDKRDESGRKRKAVDDLSKISSVR